MHVCVIYLSEAVVFSACKRQCGCISVFPCVCVYGDPKQIRSLALM